MEYNLLEVLGLDNTYENAKVLLLANSDHDDFLSPEEIPDWVRELEDFPDPFDELIEED